MKNKPQNAGAAWAATLPAGPRATPGGFTLVEMLVATGVLVLILTMTLQITNYANNLFLTTRKRIDTFQEARAGFEIMTRKISQATLNTYFDYANGTAGSGTGAPRPQPSSVNYQTVSGTWAPTQYIRNSFLHFVSGQASVTTSGSGNTIVVTSASTVSPVVKIVGQAIFFQAPLGYSDTAANSVMPNMLNTCGYFLEYGSDNPDRPAFLTGTETGVAVGGSDALPVKFRFRLKELNASSEYMYVYSYISGNQAKFGAPPLTRSLNWWYNNLISLKDSGYGTLKYNGNAINPKYTLAQNVIALVILPRRSPNYPVAAGAPIELAPSYFYDSRSWDLPLSLTTPLSIATRNQLPPQVMVTMVAIDEASAARLQSQATTPSTMPTFADSTALPGGLYNTSGVSQIFVQPSVTPGSGAYDKYPTDLTNLEQALTNLHITYRVFSTNVDILQSKFSD